MSSMKYPYRDLGVPFDRKFRNDLNANFDDIEHDIRMIGGEAAQQALEAAEEANTQAIYAQTSGDYAQDKGDYAAQQGDYAQTQGNFANEKGLYAQQQGDYAKAQGDYAKQVGDENKTRWLTAVNTYADIATTYPNPQLGDTVQTIDDSKIYRWDGTQWVWTQQYNANAITDVQNKIGILKEVPVYQEIALDRVSRYRFLNGLNNSDVSGGTYYYYSQGSCYTGDGKVVTALRGADNDNNVRLIEVDKNGNILKDAILPLDHANWISYNAEANVLYISSLKYYDETSARTVPSQKVYVVDYTNFTISNTLDFSSQINDANTGVLSFSYDPVTKQYFMVTEQNNTICKCYKVNINTLSLTEITINAYDGIFNTTYNQGMCAYDGRLYFLKYNPGVIACFDTKGNPLAYYNIPKMANEMYLVGECEQLSPVFDGNEGDFYITSSKYNCNFGQYCVFQVFKINFQTNLATNKSFQPLKVTNTVYVDAASTSINPNGTSTNPFSDINEALDMTNSVFYQNLTIIVKDGTYPFVAFYNPSAFVTVIGDSSDPTKVTINGWRGRGFNVKLQYVGIKNNNPIQTYDISAEQSKLILSSVNCLSNISYNVYLYNSEATSGGCSYSGTTPFYLQAESILKSTPYNMPLFYSPNVGLTVPNEFLVKSVNIAGVGTGFAYTFSEAEQQCLQSVKGIRIRISVDGNVFYPMVRFSSVGSGGSISLTANGFPNTVNTGISQDFVTYEIGINYTATQIYINYITKLTQTLSSTNSVTYSRVNLTGATPTIFIDQIWFIN